MRGPSAAPARSRPARCGASRYRTRTGGRARSAAVAVGALVLAFALSACAGTVGTGDAAGAPSPKDLGSVEVREYKGEKLGSVNDFRENSIKGPQRVDRATYRLIVDGDVAQPATYSYQDVVSKETSHTKVLTLNCVEGCSVKVLVEGVLLSDLIDRAQPRSDAVTVVFHAADGYTTSLPLSFVRSRNILLGYRMNGLELPVERGFPFQVMAEEKWGYKWCRWVTRIELSPNADYRGYWESRGYSTSGDLDR
ncbi:MAG TPA: molybdopterin-dependent oxidoreductase [Coriobacteriia bacterium]